jgi:hypothetical protein
MHKTRDLIRSNEHSCAVVDVDISQTQGTGMAPSYVHRGRVVRAVIHVNDFETKLDAQTISNVIFVYSAVTRSAVCRDMSLFCCTQCI